MFLPPREPFGDIVNANVKDNDLTHKEVRSYLQIMFRFLSYKICNILCIIFSKYLSKSSYQSEAKISLTSSLTVHYQILHQNQ